VIGNPPYISHDKINFRNYLKHNYETFEAFADILCYFFEIGVKILKFNGLLNFITSNSFLKAEYGVPLRKYFNTKGQFIELLNIHNTQIFEDAIVNTVIALFRKGSFNFKTKVINNEYDLSDDFEIFINSNYFNYSFKDFELPSWNLVHPDYLAVGRKINKKNRTLETLGAKIRLGLATGYNEAFVIDKKKANELIMLDPKNREIIKPLLRGRDIFRYYYKQEKFILLTKNGVDVKNDYPKIYDYLNSFGEKFKKRGAKGKHWTNLRACSFFDDFKKPKIVWIELSDLNKFTISKDEVYLLNSAYFLIPPEDLDIYFLLGVLNSKLMLFYLRLIANTSGMGTARWINVYVKKFPIARKDSIEKIITNKVQNIISIKQQDPSADTSALEAEIDRMVYDLYGLTEEEIKVVEDSV